MPAWDTLHADEQRLAARHMEVYAGFLEHTDAQIGRLVEYLESIGQLDNTLLMLISDNGASGEGGRLGCVNVDLQYQARQLEPLEVGLEALDRLGDETTNPHYPIGWAQAGSTPLKWYKTDVHGGGVRDPLIVHWPARIKDGGSLRHQYHHVVDLTPTVLDVLGIEAPTEVDGIPQLPIHGTSLAYTFGAARRSDPQADPVLRDARRPRDLAPGLEGRRSGTARRGLRGRPLGAVPPGRGLLRGPRPGGRAARATAAAGRALVGRGRRVRRAAARRPPG